MGDLLTKRSHFYRIMQVYLLKMNVYFHLHTCVRQVLTYKYILNNLLVIYFALQYAPTPNFAQMTAEEALHNFQIFSQTRENCVHLRHSGSLSFLLQIMHDGSLLPDSNNKNSFPSKPQLTLKKQLRLRAAEILRSIGELILDFYSTYMLPPTYLLNIQFDRVFFTMWSFLTTLDYNVTICFHELSIPLFRIA